jgi:threonyl-tRNA synthetase
MVDKEMPVLSSSQLIRNTAALVLAYALNKHLNGSVQFATCTSQESTFHLDFKTSRSIHTSEFAQLEALIEETIGSGLPIHQEMISRVDAEIRFKDQVYLSELIRESNQDQDVKVVKIGDLCIPFDSETLTKTSDLNAKAVRLLNVSGAYWKGDAKNEMLQRITGTAWEDEAKLKEYLEAVEEAQKRDHRYLGKQLDLFSHSEDVGQGLVLWHPKGAMVRYLAERFSQEAQLKNGYEWVYSPHIGKENLWMTSGHLSFYKDSMYAPIEIDEERYYLKPMSCPFHIEVFNSKPRSYRELPIRYAEFGTVYRYEFSGALNGLTRVRGFTQDDAHIFCTEEQVTDEIQRVLKFSLYVLRTFGLTDFTAYISTKPEGKSIGSDEDWERATEALRNAVVQENLEYEYDHGGGAFYGPKIDLKVKDSLGREWQLSTIQFDFNLSERFDVKYIGKDNKHHRPYVVHRALFGSLERFLGLLIEHYAGAFPLWLAPVQAMIVPVSDKFNDYAHEVAKKLRRYGLRVQVDDNAERMQAKVRDAFTNKIPFALVVGGKDQENQTITVRARGSQEQKAMTVGEFMDSIQEELDRGVPKFLE